MCIRHRSGTVGHLVDTGRRGPGRSQPPSRRGGHGRSALSESTPKDEAVSSGDEPRDDGTRATFTFTWRFLAILLLLSGVLYLDKEMNHSFLVGPLTVASAALVQANMEAVGLEVTRNGSLLTYDGSSFSIIADCVGLEVHGLFLAAILAVPAAFRLKLKGMAMGVPVLVLVNHIRMISLVVLGAHSAHWLDIGHLYIWPIIVIIVAIGLWLSWIRIIQDDPRFLA